MNANPVVSIYVQKESTANTVQISRLVKDEIVKLRTILEQDIQVNLTFNQADVIQQAVAQVKSSLVTGALLAIAVLLLFLGDLRLVFIIATCIPISLLMTFVFMYFPSCRSTLSLLAAWPWAWACSSTTQLSYWTIPSKNATISPKVSILTLRNGSRLLLWKALMKWSWRSQHQR